MPTTTMPEPAEVGRLATQVLARIQNDPEFAALRRSSLKYADCWSTYTGADKIVSLTSILGRAAEADDADEFWRVRHAFVELVPYFRQFHTATRPRIPATMSDELGRLVVLAEYATAPGANEHPVGTCRTGPATTPGCATGRTGPASTTDKAAGLEVDR